jgi:hypothetical protein
VNLYGPLVEIQCKDYLKKGEDDGKLCLSCKVNEYTTTETLILKSVMIEGKASGGAADEELLDPSMACWNTLGVCPISGVVMHVLKNVNALITNINSFKPGFVIFDVASICS